MYATLALALIAFCVHSEASSLRIIGGENADPDDYPFFAEIRQYLPDDPDQYFSCGGTIIYERFVLTAWHCVAVDDHHPEKGIAEPERFKVHYNISNDCNEQWKEVEVEKVIPHPGYETNPLMHDIALLMLKQAPEIALSPSVVLPPKYDDYPEVGLPGVSIGFGRTSHFNDKTPCELKQLDMEIVEPSKSCWKHSRDTFCTLSSGYDNTCHGDSGGPWLVINSTHSDTDGWQGSYTLWGVTSGGPKEFCIPDIHDGWGTRFVDVSKYVDWINKETGNVFYPEAAGITEQQEDIIPCYRPQIEQQEDITPCYRPQIEQQEDIIPCYRPQIEQQEDITPCYRPQIEQQEDITPCYRPQIEQQEDIIPCYRPQRRDNSQC